MRSMFIVLLNHGDFQNIRIRICCKFGVLLSCQLGKMYILSIKLLYNVCRGVKTIQVHTDFEKNIYCSISFELYCWNLFAWV